MQNRLYNGEMQAKNPAGLPPQARGSVAERILPRTGATEQEWWLRSNERGRMGADPPFTYYSANSLKKNNFQAGALEKDHSRRVFKDLARQGHSFSEANIEALKNDRRIRQDMQKRYFEVMGSLPGPPGPTKPSLRSSASQPTLPSVMEADRMPPGFEKFAVPQQDRVASVVSACRPSAADASRLSSIAPQSRVSLGGSAVSAARMSNVGSAIGGQGMANDMALLAEDGVEASALGVSDLSKSDFYAWRPRLLR